MARVKRVKSRLEEFYKQATEQRINNHQRVFDDAMSVFGAMIDNLAGRVDALQGKTPPQSLLNELTAVTRIGAILASSFDKYRFDPNSNEGALAIVKVLEMARRDFAAEIDNEKAGEADETNPTEEAEPQPCGETEGGAESEPVKTRQNPTPQEESDAQAGTRYQPTTHGKVRLIRGGGGGD